MDMDTEIFENCGVDMDVDTEFFKNCGVDMDVDTEFVENRDVDMDMDTAWNQCAPNSASHRHQILNFSPVVRKIFSIPV